ncbi:MAG TPA: hypothetical protein VIJ39_12325 [Solirubrobacteraceae bacterium]
MLEYSPDERAPVKLKWLCALPAIGLLVFSVTACGGARTASGSRASAAGSYFEGDDDVDDRGEPRPDPDENSIRYYGHAASANEVRAATALAKRYFAAAAMGNAGAACSLIYTSFTTGSRIARAIPPVYAPAPGSNVFSGKSCTQVASVLFQLDHQRLVEEAPTVQVTSLRFSGSEGLALLGFRSIPERWMPMEREWGAWRIGAFVDSELP